VSSLNSEVTDQVPHPHTQGLCNLQHGGKGAFHITSLHFAYEIVVQIGPLCQPLLREAGFLAIPANRLAKNFSVLGPLHNLSPKQERRTPSTQYAVYLTQLSHCAFFAGL